MVRQFVGGDATLRRLALATVDQLPLVPLDVAHAQGFGLFVDPAGAPVQWADGRPVTTSVRLHATLRTALAELVAAAVAYAPIVDEHGRPVALVTLDMLHGWLQRPLELPANGATLAPAHAAYPTPGRASA